MHWALTLSRLHASSELGDTVLGETIPRETIRRETNKVGAVITQVQALLRVYANTVIATVSIYSYKSFSYMCMCMHACMPVHTELYYMQCFKL